MLQRYSPTYLKALKRLGGTPEDPVMPESLARNCINCNERFMPKTASSDLCGWCKVKMARLDEDDGA